MRKNIQKYKGFSFIELLLTLMILMVVMLLVATTLTTISRVSVTTSNKNLARNDINYIMDTFQRTISNANIDEIYLFDSSQSTVEFVSGQISLNDSTNGGQYEVEQALGEYGNEIQVKLYGYDYWVCLGFFRDVNNYGYLFRTYNRKDNLREDHSKCFDEDAVITLLHSYSINIDEFDIQYVDMGESINSMFLINATVEPLMWPVSDTFPVNKYVSRQSVISTEALTVY